MEPHPYGQALADRDLDRLVALLADDVVFHTPDIAKPGFRGRDAVATVLAMLVDVVTDVVYTHEVGDEATRILVSDGRVLGRPIKATTVLGFDAEGKIREIWVMARPLTAVVAFVEAIGPRLAERRGPGLGAVVRVLSKPLVWLAAVAEQVGSRLISALNRSTA
jgi:ketosteroid isomerase-like protein